MRGKLTIQVLSLLMAKHGLFVYQGKYGHKTFRKYFHDTSDKIWHEIDRKQLNDVLHRFRAQGLIELIRQDEREEILLTSKGRDRFLKQEFERLTLPKKKRWDKKWRMIAFDIPETKKKARESLRRKIKALGCKEFQKSLFVYPYECQDQINFVINYFGIEEHVYYIVAQILPDTALRTYFELN